MLTAYLATKKTALRAATKTAGGSIRVDADAGVIYGAAVMSIGPAQGHGFSVDATTLQQVCDLGNAMPDGCKCHLAHPAQQADGSLEDQVDALIGRIRNFRIDGDVLRGDIYLGTYASDLPGAGDVRSYVLSLAQEDPSAVGLSAVFGYELETVLDANGMPLAEGGLVCRIDRLVQVDLVGSPAANRRGLLAAVDPPAAQESSPAATVKSAMAIFIARAKTFVNALRALRDAWAAMTTADDGTADLLGSLNQVAVASAALIDAARTCTDITIPILPGSITDDSAAQTASALIQSVSIIDDESYDVLDLLSTLRYGSNEFAAGCCLLSNYIRVCISSSDDCAELCRPLTAPMGTFFRSMHATADRLCGTNPSFALLSTTIRIRLALQRGEKEEARKIVAKTRFKSPSDLVRLAQNFPSLRSPLADADPETPALTAIPTHDDLRFSRGGEPGVQLLTWLRSRGLSARDCGECRFELYGTPDAINAITYPEESILREWAWAVAEPLSRIEGQRLATLAASAETVAERERLSLAALGWHRDCPGALAMFSLADSTMGAYAAQATNNHPDYAGLPPLPDGAAVLVI